MIATILEFSLRQRPFVLLAAVALLGDAALALDDLAGALDGHRLPFKLARQKSVAAARNNMLKRVAGEIAQQARPIRSRQGVGAINRIFVGGVVGGAGVVVVVSQRRRLSHGG